MTAKELIAAAETACKNAYAPYSGFRVGAAAVTSEGKVYTGCNVENASYGGCICAERTAAVKAVSDGAREISAIAVVNAGGGLTYPCGICLQFLSEFAAEDLTVYMKDDEGKIVSVPFGELLPKGFRLDDKD